MGDFMGDRTTISESYMPPVTRPRLGQHLEWHGNSIRVVLSVPHSLRGVIGSNKLRASIPTANPRKAETLKLPVLLRMREQIEQAKRNSQRGDGVIARALPWREELAKARAEIDEEAGELEAPRDVIDGFMRDEAREIERRHGEAAAEAFVRVAEGVQTPIEFLEADWLARKPQPRTLEARKLALRRFKDWCAKAGIAQTIEAVTGKVAGRYVSEQFERRGTHPATANKDIGALSSFWSFLEEKDHAHSNPWKGKRLAPDDRGAAEDRDTDKRPFTDAEVAKLLAYPQDDALGDMMRIAALTGMRISEIASLQVRHVQHGLVSVTKGKTKAARRSFPLHSGLADIIERRTRGKNAEAYLIDELPDQPNGRRSRAAPVTQAFTRWRRKAGVDERKEGVRQSSVDFHSWRRWFMRKAADAILAGKPGFSAWTLADVVGHSKGEMPLELTMGLYPGKASEDAMRACVEAVRLPEAQKQAVSHERENVQRAVTPDNPPSQTAKARSAPA